MKRLIIRVTFLNEEENDHTHDNNAVFFSFRSDSQKVEGASFLVMKPKIVFNIHETKEL